MECIMLAERVTAQAQDTLETLTECKLEPGHDGPHDYGTRPTT